MYAMLDDDESHACTAAHQRVGGSGRSRTSRYYILHICMMIHIPPGNMGMGLPSVAWRNARITAKCTTDTQITTSTSQGPTRRRARRQAARAFHQPMYIHVVGHEAADDPDRPPPRKQVRVDRGAGNVHSLRAGRAAGASRNTTPPPSDAFGIDLQNQPSPAIERGTIQFFFFQEGP